MSGQHEASTRSIDGSIGVFKDLEKKVDDNIVVTSYNNIIGADPGVLLEKRGEAIVIITPTQVPLLKYD